MNEIAKTIISTYLGVGRCKLNNFVQEEILIITNPSREDIADQIFNAVLDLKDVEPAPEVTKVVITPRTTGERANNVIAHAVK